MKPHKNAKVTHYATGNPWDDPAPSSGQVHHVGYMGASFPDGPASAVKLPTYFDVNGQEHVTYAYAHPRGRLKILDNLSNLM